MQYNKSIISAVILSLTMYNSSYAVDLNVNEDSNSALGVNLDASFKIGISPKLKELSFNQEPRCAVSIKPFIALNDNNKIGTKISLFQKANSAAYVFANINGFSVNIGCTNSALSNNEISTLAACFKYPPKLCFKNSEENNKEHELSYPQNLDWNTTLYLNNYISSKYLAPQVCVITPKMYNMITMSASYSPFSTLSSTIEKKKSAFRNANEKNLKTIDKIKQENDNKNAIKYLKKEDVKSYCETASHTFSFSPKIDIEFSDNVSITCVTGVETSEAKTTFFNTDKDHTCRLLSTYLGSTVCVGNLSLYGEFSRLDEFLISNKIPSHSLMTAVKFQFYPKMDLALGISRSKQANHYMDINSKKENKFRGYNIHTSYIAGIHYTPIETLTVYLEGKLATTKDCDHKNNPKYEKDVAKALSMGIAIKI